MTSTRSSRCPGHFLTITCSFSDFMQLPSSQEDEDLVVNVEGGLASLGVAEDSQSNSHYDDDFIDENMDIEAF